MSKRILVAGFLIILLAAAAFLGWNYFRKTPVDTGTIGDYESCAAAGFPIMESYPEKCRTPNGKTFTRQIGMEIITVTGETVCLPHKDTSGPQTLECAFGIKGDTGVYYGLNDPNMQYTQLLSPGKTVRVTGNLKQPPADSKYDIVGVIEVTNVQE